MPKGKPRNKGRYGYVQQAKFRLLRESSITLCLIPRPVTSFINIFG